jgi:hypothetical protein
MRTTVLFNRNPIWILCLLFCLSPTACNGGDFTSAAVSKKKESSTDGKNSDNGNNTEVDSDGLKIDAGCLVWNGTGSRSSDLLSNNFRSSFFHETAAVDPAGTGRDPSVNHNFPPVVPVASDTLLNTEFVLTTNQLKNIINSGESELEYVVFAHQFDRGTDRIKIEIDTANTKYSDVSPTNIYSAFGFLSVKNLRWEDNKPYGDIAIFSFNYDPKGTGPLFNELHTNPSPRDGTSLAGPASRHSEARVNEKNVDLSKFKVTITIDAILYDSVQYRAIRASLWSGTDPAKVFCND